MASQPSNFDAEIKKGMQGKAAKSSTNDTPVKKAPAASGEFNQAPKPSPAQPTDTSGDTGAAMEAAGQAHMAAIHAHINAMKGC